MSCADDHKAEPLFNCKSPNNNTLHTEPRAARLFLLARLSPRPGERCRYPARASVATVPTTLHQSIKLRLAIPNDLPTLGEIRRHPLVAPHQYRINYPMWLEIWLARLNADVSTTHYEWRTTTILFESKVVGYISEFRSFRKSTFSVHLGWNLHPDYWGRGVMTTALTEFVTTLLLSSEQCTSIVADCFDSNERCLRLLSRLGFAATPIGAIERFLTLVFRLCPHRILRHELNPLQWRVQTNPDSAG